MDTGNTAWIITSTALVLFMTLPGLALFYAGLVRASNILSVLMHCFTIACISSIAWLVIAYSIAFSGDAPYFGDLGNLFLANLSRDSMAGDIPESVFFMFQMTFAIITPALIVGAYPERIKFSFVAVFSLLWVILIYAPIVHWIWAEGGWLYEMGKRLCRWFGCSLTAGITALCAFSWSKGWISKFGSTSSQPRTNDDGACMLWVGWFGFNGGSALAANGDAGMAILVTHISAATATIVGLSLKKLSLENLLWWSGYRLYCWFGFHYSSKWFSWSNGRLDHRFDCRRSMLLHGQHRKRNFQHR